MSNEMVERVARVLAKIDEPDVEFDIFDYESQNHYRKMAEAAILEMEKMEFNDRLDQEDLEECMNKDD